MPFIRQVQSLLITVPTSSCWLSIVFSLWQPKWNIRVSGYFHFLGILCFHTEIIFLLSWTISWNFGHALLGIGSRDFSYLDFLFLFQSKKKLQTWPALEIWRPNEYHLPLIRFPHSETERAISLLSLCSFTYTIESTGVAVHRDSSAAVVFGFNKAE